VAGLICGILWEFWNFWAPTKWIYTVPFFEEGKIFEMPVLGFLGFPPFAVSAYVMYRSILRAVGEGPGWKRVIAWCVIGACCGSVFAAIDRHTIVSYRTRVEDMQGIEAGTKKRLAEAGISRLVELRRTPRDVLKRLDISARQIEELKKQADVMMVRGVGSGQYRALVRVGIASRGQLAREDPAELYAKLQGGDRTTYDAIAVPSPAIVRLWVREARRGD
jgi:hypothetical protein